ncbi:MAG TPA: GlsB/YeaQ/YmgE family stress response membrane protein [Polyangiaceae bacterium]|nr:GlsB/YeaQ/YmgE family stress response membrane protein [Polyangiaceae bacterium]
MGLLMFLLFGFVIGLLARAIMPGNQRMGVVMTTLLGAAGSLLGGFVGSLISGYSVADVHAAGFIGSLLGALGLLFIAGRTFTRRTVL